MARGAPPPQKTQPKSRGLPPHLTPGNPGNSGGKPGRSGRKPDLFYQRAKQLCNDPKVWDAAHKFARAGSLKPLELAASYTYEKPAERKELTGEVSIRVLFDD